MIRLVFGDLRDHAATWVGAFLIAVGCGFIGGWAASLELTASAAGMRFVGAVMLVFSSVAAVTVLVSAANLTVSVQRRSYALWQLANVSPRTIAWVVLVQLAVVAVMGAICGTLLAAATFAPLFPVLFGAKELFNQMTPQVSFSLMPTVWLVVAGVFLVGGARGARSASKTPPLAVLRKSEPQRKRMTRLRGVMFAILVACTGLVVFIMIGATPGVVMNWSLYLPVLVTAALASVSPLVFSALLGAWTSLVPQKRWCAWYLARHTARLSLSASTSVQTPIMVGFGLVAGLFSVVNVWGDYAARRGEGFTGLSSPEVMIMLGGPVLLCAIGAAVSVVMSSRTRTRDVALLVASGARPQTLMAAAACEAFIHAVTATAVGMAGVVVSTAIVAFVVGMPLFEGLALEEGLLVSLVGFVLISAATVIPTWSALNREAATVLSVAE